MDSDSKVEMCKCLNNGKYKEAVEVFANAEEWDNQAVDMFANGFSLTEIDLLKPLSDRILSANVVGIGWRALIRWATIKDELEKLTL